MDENSPLRLLVLKSLKTLVALFTLAAISWAVGAMPLANDLPFISSKLPVAVFIDALLASFGITVFVLYGAEISPYADALLPRVPGAGALAGNLVKLLATLFAFDSFKAPVFPFIPEYEWLYQSVFLGLSLFFLARAGLIVYAASETIGGFLLELFTIQRRPPKDS